MGNHCKTIINEDNNSTLIIHKQDSQKKVKIIKKIENLKMSIMSISIFKRNEIATFKYKRFLENYNSDVIKENNILQKYIDIMELLLLNNTNKNIVKLYLDFLKNNNDFVKDYELNSYKEEIMKYKILFTVKEMENIEPNLKLINEKQNLINFLKKFSETKINNEFISYIKDEYKNIYYFNYPIEFFQNELFYYKLFILIIIELYNNITNGEKYFEVRRKVAEYVYKKNIFNNEDIINNEDKMNILIILILYDELDKNNESTNFNRLLETKDITIDEIKKYIIENNLNNFEIKKKGNSYYLEILFKEENTEYNWTFGTEIKNPSDFCLINFSSAYSIRPFNNFLLNNINGLLKKNELTCFLGKIKEFLIKFINSNVYKEAITLLFPNYSKYILNENLKDLEIIINKRLKFYPYQDLNNSGLTEKFSLYSYIPILLFKFNTLGENLEKSLKISVVVENCIHEINHINQDIIFFRGNDKDLFLTPKRKEFKGEDGGEYLEGILFGDKIKYLRILESLYILNEDNYNQNLEDFKHNFQNLYKNSVEYSEKKKYLKINEHGIFHDICINIDKYTYNEIQRIELSSIANKIQQISFIDAYVEFPKDKCKMGA